jgi:hypothetical protein
MNMHFETRMMVANAMRRYKELVYNLLYFAEHSPTENELSYIRNCVLSLPDHVRMKFARECDYVSSLPLTDLNKLFIPYPAKELVPADVAVGREDGVPYVEHRRNGKLYFPSYITDDEVRVAYTGLVNCENIIGDGGSPHCYQDVSHFVEPGDVILDIGCAEALFALDNIEKASRVYLFEALRSWRRPLARTFAPHAEKTIFVNKLVSDKTGRKSTTIADAIQADSGTEQRYFVKMDIEGGERFVIQANAEFFKNNKVKLSCCVYHRHDDADVIAGMLNSLGYSTRFSEGYMLSAMNGIHFPYFRHGVIYARNY